MSDCCLQLIGGKALTSVLRAPKCGVIPVNIARGMLVDECALLAVVEDGQIRLPDLMGCKKEAALYEGLVAPTASGLEHCSHRRIHGSHA